MVRKLDTIQKNNNLNSVYSVGDIGQGGAYHDYVIKSIDDEVYIGNIYFQKGPRNEPDSRNGALDCDLLEIVRDRLKCFQNGEYATRENAIALTKIEEALLWLNKRVEDRASRGVLGTMNK